MRWGVSGAMPSLSSQILVKEPTPITELRSLFPPRFFSADSCGQEHSHLLLLASDHLQSQDEGAKKQFSPLGLSFGPRHSLMAANGLCFLTSFCLPPRGYFKKPIVPCRFLLAFG